MARCTFKRLMRAEGLRGIPRERTRKTKIRDGAETDRSEDKVKRPFVTTAANQLWGGPSDLCPHARGLDQWRS